MRLRNFRFKWDGGGLSPQQKFDMLRKRTEKDVTAWLVGYFWHADAQDLARQLTVVIEEREAAIAQLDIVQAGEREKYRVAEVDRREAAPLCGNQNAPFAERDAAQVKSTNAIRQAHAAGIAIRRAEVDKRPLREPLPTMARFRDLLLTVAAPSPRPDFARFLLNMAQDEAEAGRK